MNTFLDFLSDNTFFSIFSGVIIVLVLAFIITLIKGNKDTKAIAEVKEDNYLNTMQESISPLNTESAMIESQMLGTNSLETGYKAAFTNYVPDLNEKENVNMEIPSVSSDIRYDEPIIPNAPEMAPSISGNQENVTDVPIISPVNDTLLDSNKAINLEVNDELPMSNDQENSIIPDFSAKEETVAVEPINETELNDEIEMPIPITETPELAFASLPSEDNFINEDIKIEQSEEYDFEKTEIFDFPDFSKTEKDSEILLVDVEKVVMEAANKYIDSVMKS